MKVKISVVLLVVVCSLTLLLEPCQGAKRKPKIVGGSTTTISRLKYLVYLRRYNRFACGGSLVSARFVVTAAHCVDGYPASAMTITGGSSYLNRPGKTRRVARYFVGPKFTRQTMNNDIAVIKLQAPMQGSNIATIPLCSHRMKTGAKLRVAGWGITNENSSNPSTQVRTTIIRLRSRTSCSRSYSGFGFTKSMMCAAAPRVDTCSGDSGGPVVHKGQLCGVVSWGVGCARDAYPGVYTVVNRVKGFITKSLKK